jgi:urease accessory protein
MLDSTAQTHPLQRARGRAAVALSRRGGGTRLDRLEQVGCAKAFLPRVAGDPEVVFLNTAGGLTGGDRLAYALEAGAGARVAGTTQTAERAYASPGGAAEVSVALRAGPGAVLHWLPQETILFDRSALARGTLAEIAADATFLTCEMLVLGRAAMGETVRQLALSDRREVRRAGRPVLIDPVEIGAQALALREAPAVLDGARAHGFLALVGPGAEDALGPLRAQLGQDGVRAAASAWDGRCVVRLMGADAMPLRLALARLVAHLRGGALPRVWQI